MDKTSPSKLKSALIGGAPLGLLGGIPVINVGCCLWTLGAGFLAGFLYSKECKNAGARFGTGPGALVGLFAGLFYTLIAAPLFSLIRGGDTMDPDEIDQAIAGWKQWRACRSTFGPERS